MNGSVVRSLVGYDPHMKGQTDPTPLQLALLWVWVVSLFIYITRVIRGKRGRRESRDAEGGATGSTEAPPQGGDARAADDTKPDSLGEAAKGEKPNDIRVSVRDAEKQNHVTANGGKDAPERTSSSAGNQTADKRFSAVRAPPTFEEFLSYVIKFGIVMMFFYYSDYVKVFPRGDRLYSRDTFLFLVFLLFLVGTIFTLKPTKDQILNRNQTEEWKGWMQVMFVWYHYFAAAEWYNWIRIYIAAYVWMTGFGNFSFFWVRKDFSVLRMLKMLFRLNFLVLLICATVSNPYMLYYICPMHTYWFVSVYVLMAVKPSWNNERRTMLIKFAIYAVVNSLIFDVPGAAEYVFYPLWPLLGFDDGKSGIMHEWSFRLGLDHWMCFIGMLCAYVYPAFEAFVLRIESRMQTSRMREMFTKILVTILVVAVYAAWHGLVLLQSDKFEYNKLHPYTSFIPVLAFVWLRNLVPALRTRYISMFAELGKITLETYLSQLHVYLQSNAKQLVNYIDGYPLLNFSFNSALYLAISHTLFSLTTDLSAYLLPSDTRAILRRNLGVVVAFAVALGLGYASTSLGSLSGYLS